jgi:hypothetical protein
MVHAIENKSLLHDNTAKRLITKLIIDRTKVGDDWRQERAKLIDTFLTEYGILLARGEALPVITYGSLPQEKILRLIDGTRDICCQ